MPSSPPSPADGSVPADADFALSGSGLAAFVQSYWTPAGRQAAWNLGWLIAGMVVSQGCGLAGVLVLTRALGPEQFGIYAFSMTLYGYLSMIALAGMGSVVVREVTRRPQQVDRILGAYVSIALAASVVVSALAWVGVQFTAASADEKFLIGCIALANLATCGQLFPFLDAHHRQAAAAMVSAAVDLVWLGALLACYAAGVLTVPAAGGLLVLRSFATMAGSVLAYRRVTGSLRLRIGTGEIAGMALASGRLLLAQLVATIPLTSGVMLVRIFDGESAAGIMGLAVMALQSFLQLNSLAIRVVFPHITGPYGQERSFRRKLWAFFLSYLALLFAAIVTGIWIIVSFLLAQEFAHVLVVGLVLLCGGVFKGIASLYTSFLLAEQRDRVVVGAHLLSAAAFIALAIPGAIYWSSSGVALGFVGSAVILWLVMVLFGHAPALLATCKKVH